MHVLVINCGSSSIKAAVLRHDTGERAAHLKVERLGDDTQLVSGDVHESIGARTHAEALAVLLPRLLATGVAVAAVGHRVVHGGDYFMEPTTIDDGVIGVMEALTSLAPLHLPANLAGIRAARELLPDLTHVAVFDTAFHATLPHRATQYALPRELCEQHGIRRYGFHGPSHAYVAMAASQFLGEDVRDLRLITCHLGNGASVCAIEYGRSIETSMGMTPLEGLVMGTRSGDVDPGVLLHLLRSGMSVDELDATLNQRSGLAGLSGVGNDLRDIEARAAEGDEACRAAIGAYAHRVRKYIGAYAAVLGGVDAIVFTGRVGENSALMRHRIAQRLDFLGARMDDDRNRDVELGSHQPIAEFSQVGARCRLLAVKTDEQHAIARGVAVIVDELSAVPEAPSIPIAISARHVHLTASHVHALFGAGHKLTPRKWLTQPGQFACEERVAVVGPKGRIERVGIIGPVRRASQVEISRTDEFSLGIDAPIRPSGKHDDSPGITLVGPAGEIALERGVIQAERHIHMTPADAEEHGVSDGDYVEVRIDSAGRDLIFGDVLIRVKSSYALEMHIDTDEANAADISRGDEGVLASTTACVRLQRKRMGVHLSAKQQLQAVEMSHES